MKQHMIICYYNEKKTLKIEVYRANAEAVSVQENNLNIEEEIGKYEIVSDSITSEMYWVVPMRWNFKLQATKMKSPDRR